MFMKHLYNLVNLIVVTAIGVIYVEVIKFSMTKYISVFGDAYSTVDKVLVTGTATSLAVLVIFMSNWLVTHQKPMWVATACSFVALVYFYQINPGGNILINVFMNFFYIHSTLAFIFFTIAPLAVGAIINKARQDQPV